MTRLFVVAALLISFLSTAQVHAESKSKPLWEVGAVAGSGYVPDYPAAGQSHFQWAGAPVVIYRGDILRIGEKGLVRGRLIHTDRMEFDVSLGGSFPTDADDNTARRGMSDLDWLGEVGPRLEITLARAARDAKVDLELAARAVFSTDFSSVEHQGFVFAPELAYQHDNFLDQDIRIKLGLTVDFASEGLSDYFYEVPANFVTANRAAFKAKAGYMGTKLQLSGYKQLSDRWRVFAAFNIESHHGAANKNSPLFLNSSNAGVGFGVVWSFWQSDRRVTED